MTILAFQTFIKVLDDELRASVTDATALGLYRWPHRAQWTRALPQAGIERRDLSAYAWIALDGTVVAEFHEPLTTSSAIRLGYEFAALLTAGEVN